MKITVNVRRAMGDKVPSLCINAESLVREGQDSDWQKSNERMFAEDAKAIAEAMYKTLPGGTVDALLLQLLTRKAAKLMVPFERPTIEQEPT